MIEYYYDNARFINAQKLKPVRNLTFKVQVGAYSKKVSEKLFNPLGKVNVEILPKGYSAYLLEGVYTNLAAAERKRSFAISKGFTDTYVVIYYNGKRILSENLRKERLFYENGAEGTVLDEISSVTFNETKSSQIKESKGYKDFYTIRAKFLKEIELSKEAFNKEEDFRFQLEKNIKEVNKITNLPNNSSEENFQKIKFHNDLAMNFHKKANQQREMGNLHQTAANLAREELSRLLANLDKDIYSFILSQEFCNL